MISAYRSSLAINWADEGALPPGYVGQLALAPEDEAASAARRGLPDGHRRALVLGQNTDQGQRMAESFIAAFQQGGGEVLAWQVYDPRNKDFAFPIRALLLLDESDNRHQRIQLEAPAALAQETLLVEEQPVSLVAHRVRLERFVPHQANDIFTRVDIDLLDLPVLWIDQQCSHAFPRKLRHTWT